MEIRRDINPKDLLRPVVAGILLFANTLPAFAGGDSENPQINTTVRCSDKPAYGLIDIGPHAEVNVNATNLNSVATQLEGGAWLYIGKIHSASQDPYEARGYRVVGYNSDSDSFAANMDGFINSIRGQDVTSDDEVKPITFNPGDVIGVMLRRGPYTENLPYTDMVAQVEVEVPVCTAEDSGN